MLRKHGPFVLAAAVAALLTVPAIYALLRAYSVLFGVEANPAVVSPSVKVAMFWRIAIGLYIAPVVGVGGYGLARRDLARTMRLLYVASLVVAAMIGAQGLMLP
jgi:hypothetical protein